MASWRLPDIQIERSVGLEDGSTAESRSASNDPVALYCH